MADGFKRLSLEEKLVFPDGRLLVHGRNESGKSTLMEAIHYALYGTPLRPSKNAGNEDIICYGKDRAVVELEFTIDDSQYQVRRELYRKKTNEHILNKRDKDGQLSRVTRGARNVNSALEEILHGIDSDALLNSCLVEQKELGKLEDAKKEERVRAMSSLLNLEAFVDARNQLKKDNSELEKTNLQTQKQLQIAEQAKQEYEEAEQTRESAQKRLQEIEGEKHRVQEAIERLRKELETIQRMKTHQTKINESRTKRDGLEKQLEQFKKQLEELEKAEKELKKIDEELPEAEKTLAELEKQLEVVQQISQLEENLRQAEARQENNEIKLGQNQRLYEEAAEAAEKITELDELIQQYAPVKQAAKTLDEINSIFNRLAASQDEANRLESDYEDIQTRLNESEESEATIKKLEAEEVRLTLEQKRLQSRKMTGLVLFFIGLVIIVYTRTPFNILYTGLGALVMIGGGFLFTTSQPKKLEIEAYERRKEREQLLGMQARIKEHHEEATKLETLLIEARENVSRLEDSLVQSLNRLPIQPRDYKSTVSLTEPETLTALRNQIQEDNEAYTRYNADRENHLKKANGLDSAKEALESTLEAKEKLGSETSTLRNQLHKTTEETGASGAQEEAIRKQYNESNRAVTELSTRKNENQRALEKRPELKEAVLETSNEINLLAATIKREEEAIKELEKLGVNPGDEPTITGELESSLEQSSSLKTQEQERRHDITEAEQKIEKNRELKEQYPALLEETMNQRFQLEAMKRAGKLLDITRDNIMAGVKQNVEKNMMQFLPTLTDNRYNMARIDEANYRIEVYDREAKTWRGKGVFSGATQDQFSLALRLAFAISTIPSSRGARPGFIFLDEPLSGFDAQRRSGFMQLLREDLSKHFDQIIVISHLEALTEEFQNNITLDSGRIIEVQR